jgi:hypothetical protein
VTDFHVISPVADELIMQGIDGQLVIVPPAPRPEPIPPSPVAAGTICTSP